MAQRRGSRKLLVNLPAWIEPFIGFPDVWAARVDAGEWPGARYPNLGSELLGDAVWECLYRPIVRASLEARGDRDCAIAWRRGLRFERLPSDAQELVARALAHGGVTEQTRRIWARTKQLNRGRFLWVVERQEFVRFDDAETAIRNLWPPDYAQIAGESLAEGGHHNYAIGIETWVWTACVEGQHALALDRERQLRQGLQRLHEAAVVHRRTHAKLRDGATPGLQALRAEWGVSTIEFCADDQRTEMVRLPAMNDVGAVAGAVLGWALLAALRWLDGDGRRVCEVCGEALPCDASIRLQYCSDACRTRGYRDRRRCLAAP